MTGKRYQVRAAGPTYTTQGARWHLVIDTEKQDAIIGRYSDVISAEKLADQMNTVVDLLGQKGKAAR